MARKKQRKNNWLRTLVLFLVIPLAVWLIAFLIWFYGYDLNNLFTKDEQRRVSPKPPRQIEKDERRERTPAPPQEKIFEEDRKKLEDVLKRRN